VGELPQLAALYKKYSEQGLHIIGLECQQSPATDITNLAKSKGCTYQMTTGGDLKGANVTGIPHGFLFSADGKLAADDPRGGQLETKIKDLLKDAGAAWAGEGPYVKLAPLAAQIKLGQGLGQVLKTLATKKDSKDAAEAAEAKMMYDALSTGSKEAFDRAVADKDANPLSALARLDKLAGQFAGDDLGTKAKAEADKLKNDPKVRKEQEADGMYKQLETICSGMRAVANSKDPKNDAFRRTNAQAIASVVSGCQTIIQRYPGTAAATKAEEMMGEYK
jgi:hypothetical protein